MKLYPCKHILMAAILWICAVVSPAQGEGDGFQELSLNQLLSLALQTGSFLDLDLMKSPLSMTVIKREDIDVSGARHLTELLEIYVPGFQYMYNKWNGEIWGMRGVAADRNTKFIFLVNGHKMNHESRDGAISEISLGLLGDIERVEVLRGPAGLVYGSGAIAGIVNVVTKKYEADQTVVRGGLGTWDFSGTSKEFGFDIHQGLEDNQTLVVSMGFRQSDGLAAEEARLWGRPHWPYPAERGNDGQSSVPSAGCAWCTPGNWRVSLDYQWENLRLYTRVTHQVSNAGGMFILDPWPEDLGNSNRYASPKLVDGKLVRSWEVDSVRISRVEFKNVNIAGVDTVIADTIRDTTWRQTWWGSTESWNTNRRQYQVDNIMAELNYHVNVGSDELKLKAGFDGVTNRIVLEERKGFEQLSSGERNTQIEEAFGERRYSLGATYLLKRIEKLQAAMGYEFRLDDIGDDLTGKNSQKEMPLHKIVSDVRYINHAIFGEMLYEINPSLLWHSGLRYDAHTRTINQGGVFSPKLSLIYKVGENHSVKMIYQTSSNNGSADNYEYNRNNYNDQGVAYDDYHFEKPTEPPGANSTPIPGVSLEELHKLKPERVRSLELTSVHLIGPVTLQPSVSYNQVKDLFTWNQQEFRVINSGEYEFINADIDASAEWGRFRLGAMHTLQRLVNMRLSDHDYISYRDKFDADSFWVEYVENGITKYKPQPNGLLDTVTTNSIRDQITVDGKNFLNLNTHVSKFYLNARILRNLAWHTDVRVFYGLWGRRPLVESNPGFDYLNIHLNPMVKWNMSLHWNAGANFRVSCYAYDLLGSENSLHSLRWQQAGNSKDHTDLYGLDRRSFAVQVEKKF